MWPYAGPPPGPPPQPAGPCGGGYGMPCGGSAVAPAGLAAAPAQEASTSVNIAILDSKDFPAEVAPTSELHTEFVMADGAVLFKCGNLVKASGIDLMNCPLNLVLKLLVKRRGNPMVLWHLVLHLPTISKSLVNPPFEWETWIGLFPNTQNLDQHPPETMFTQAVHLISRPDFPKLRLRFSYHNPQLQEQLTAQQKQKDEESRRRVEETQKFGKAEFEEIQRMAMSGGTVSQATSSGRAKEVPRPAAARDVQTPSADAGGRGAGMQSTAGPDRPQQVAVPISRSSEERLQEAMLSSLRFMDGVRGWLENQQAQRRGMSEMTAPPRPLDPNEVLGSPNPAALVDSHCQHLRHCMQAVPAGGPGQPLANDAEVEAMLCEALQMAMMGMLDHRDEGKMPTTMTNLSSSTTDQLSSVRKRYPRLWDTLAEVSTMSTERASLMEQQRRMR